VFFERITEGQARCRAHLSVQGDERR
jgi:hypothetical protein